MKKQIKLIKFFIIVIILSLITLSVCAQNNTFLSNIKPIVEFEGGWKKQTNSITNYDLTINTVDGNNYKIYYEDYNYDNMNKYNCYTNITIGANYKNIYILSNIENYFGHISGKNFRPYQVIYTMSVQYKYKSLTLSYEHMCSHPIVSKQSIDYIFNSSFLRQSSDKITLKIKIY